MNENIFLLLLLLLMDSAGAKNETIPQTQCTYRTESPEMARTLEVLKQTSINFHSFLLLDFHLTCKTPFCAMIIVSEADTLESDVKKVVEVTCTNTTELHHQEVVMFNGEEGDGMYDGHYEPVVDIYSDCRKCNHKPQHKVHKRVLLSQICEHGDVRAQIIEETFEDAHVSDYPNRIWDFKKVKPLDQVRRNDTIDWVNNKRVCGRERVYRKPNQCFHWVGDTINENTITLEDCV